MLSDHVGRFRHRHGRCRLGLQTGHAHPVQPAGRDGQERRQGLAGDVDREAVHRNPFPHAHPDGSELAVLHPHAGHALAAACGNPKLPASGDERVLDEAEVEMKVAAARVEVEDGIADELPRAVVGGLAAAVCFENGMWQGCRRAEGGLVAQAADGIDRLMLQQENGVAGLTGEDRGHGVFLHRQPVGVGNGMRDALDFQGRFHRLVSASSERPGESSLSSGMPGGCCGKVAAQAGSRAQARRTRRSFMAGIGRKFACAGKDKAPAHFLR